MASSRDTRRNDDRDGRRSTAAPIIGAGGLVLIIGTMLPWANQSVSEAANQVANQVNESIAGSSFSDGRVAMGLGFAMVAIAAMMLANRRVGSWFDADLLGLALSTTALVITIATWVALNTGTDEVSRTADIGLYIALIGSLIALAGSLAGLMRSDSDRAAEGQRRDVVGTDAPGSLGRN